MTAEGGAPITPETSTWEPRTGVEPVGEWVDEAAGWLEANGGVQLEPWQRAVLGQAMQADTLDVRMDNRAGTFTPTSPLRRIPYGEEWTDVTEHVAGPAPGVKVELGLRAEPPTNYGGMLADLEEGICIDCGKLRYEHHGPGCPRVHRSWFSRLWRWMWLRG